MKKKIERLIEVIKAKQAEIDELIKELSEAVDKYEAQTKSGDPGEVPPEEDPDEAQTKSGDPGEVPPEEDPDD